MSCAVGVRDSLARGGVRLWGFPFMAVGILTITNDDPYAFVRDKEAGITDEKMNDIP